LSLKSNGGRTMEPGRALILEDDLWLKPLIEVALLQTNPIIHVDWVDSAEEAIQKARQSNYELIIADIFLKGTQTGLEFWDYCKQECPETTVLLTSAMPVELFLEHSAKGRDNPFFLPKPFTMKDLLRTLHGLLDYSGISS